MKNLKGKRLYSVIPAILIGCGVSLLTGCSGQQVQVTIQDGRVSTVINISDGKTVEDALKEAEITIGKKDEVIPDIDTALTAEVQEICIRRYADVMVSDGSQEKTIKLTGKTVQDALDATDIEIGKNDYINHDRKAYLFNGMQIKIIRRCVVKISVDDKEWECLTSARTVEELLKEQGIILDARDLIHPGLEEEINDGMNIEIERISVKQVTEKEKIEYDTHIEYSDTMYEGESQEKQAGAPGEKEVVYEITYVDGKESSRRVVSEKILKNPVTRIIVQGTMKRVEEQSQPPERTVVSKQDIDDCDGSGHGYSIITWSDGTVEYQDY